MLSLIEKDVVDRYRWLTKEEFLDLFAVAQSLPGVFAVNLSIFIGYRLRGILGGTIAALGTILPSFVIILLLAFFYRNVQDNRVVGAIMSGIRPAVVALIAYPVYTTWRAMKLPRPMVLVPIGVAVGVWYFGISPIWVIVLAGVVGIIYTFVKAYR